LESEVEAKIKKILISELEIKSSIVDACDSGTPLLGRGIGLDSVEILSLVAGIEKEFDIQIDDDDLTADLFKDIGTVAEYVLRKMEGQKGR
jgi:acyl carrier protein